MTRISNSSRMIRGKSNSRSLPASADWLKCRTNEPVVIPISPRNDGHSFPSACAFTVQTEAAANAALCKNSRRVAASPQ